MTGRLSPFKPGRLTEAQQAVYDAITSGPRASDPAAFPLCHDDGSLVGPFNALVAAGEIGRAVQAVGAAVRYHGRLAPDARELAVLLVARHRRAAFEWYAHAPIARRSGLAESVVEAVRDGRQPVLTDPADLALAAVHDTVAELLATGRLAQPTFDAAIGALGEEGVVELVILTGYYGMLADVLNSFDVGAPGGDPFGPTGLDGSRPG